MTVTPAAGTPTSPSVRRPPAPTEHLATVTHLVSPDERPAPVPLAYVQGTLALDLGSLPPSPTTPDLHVVPGEDSAEQREVQAWAARFAQATVEVLGGDRPVSQLLRWTSGRVYADLERRSRIIARATVPALQRRRTVRPQVRSVHVFRPGPDSAEVSVHVQYGQRSRALAARLERHEDRWRCMALQLG